MARIEETNRDIAPDTDIATDTAVPGFDAPRDATVSLPLDVLDQSNLVTLVQVLRRPPEMPLTTETDGQTQGLEDVRAAELDPILFQGTSELSYQIAALVVRREAEVDAAQNPQVSAGFEKMAQTLRMFEHLHVQRNAPAGA